MTRSTALLPLLLATAAIAGCDSNSSGETQDAKAGAGASQVSANDVAEIIVARQTITEVCTDERPRSDLLAAVGSVTRIVEEGPSDRFESGQTETPQTLSSVADDLARALDACQADALADQLRTAATGERPVQKGSPGY